MAATRMTDLARYHREPWQDQVDFAVSVIAHVRERPEYWRMPLPDKMALRASIS